ncbi:hypothetical protein SAMN05660826_01814 [Caldanaerovirga acetigignens]|uniref:Uncharacterized protein n=1 Tax=Caldanaerovirga acetigignens TaxID=447595 RepID=A0A1M7L7W0_9FIRM|nr:hypothetical protein [Caldanaerovirga acetigignens]SHM74126.1 hypothetical protein SAMN05660826_01814 [Caldanaerovirga acetigignens]
MSFKRIMYFLLMLCFTLLLYGCKDRTAINMNKAREKELKDVIQVKADVIEELIINNLKNEIIGVSGWIVDYADENNIIFHNYAHLFKFNISSKKFSCHIDLTKIDADHVQGSVVTNFFVSPDGNYVVINNGGAETDVLNREFDVYFCNLGEGQVKVIAKKNNCKTLYCWSKDSAYFIMAARNGENMEIYDVHTGSIENIPFGKENISNIFITEGNNILIDGKEKYLIKLSTKEIEKLPIEGILIGEKEGEIYYFNDGKICSFNFVNSYAVENIGEKYKLFRISGDYAVFTGEKDAKIFDKSKSKMVSYPVRISENTFYYNASPDRSKLLVVDGNITRVYSSNGTFEEITVDGFNFYMAKWISEEDILQVYTRNFSPVQIIIVNYNVKDKKLSTIYNSET